MLFAVPAAIFACFPARAVAIAFSEAKALSLAEEVALTVVCKTPDFKLLVVKSEIVLSSASIVLFVRVSVLEAVIKVLTSTKPAMTSHL